MRTARLVPAWMVTFTGPAGDALALPECPDVGAAPGSSACAWFGSPPSGITFGSCGGGTGPPGGGGVLVVEIAPALCPLAGACTTVVVVIPALSTATTCCGSPVEAACCLAWSIALSIFDWHAVSVIAKA